MYIVDTVIDNKLGRSCPTTETVSEHPSPWTLPGSTSGYRHTIDGATNCLFAEPDEDCVSLHADSLGIEPSSLPTGSSLYAVAPDRTTVVVARSSVCAIVWPTGANSRELAVGKCSKARFLDRTTVALTESGVTHVVDITTGGILGEGDPAWLGGGLALLRRGAGTQIDLVEREHWSVLASIDLVTTITDKNLLVLVGATALVQIRVGAPISRTPLAGIVIERVLDARGDRMLCQLHRTDKAIELAIIDMSTGTGVSRSIISR